jgi:hypothetical protein
VTADCIARSRGRRRRPVARRALLAYLFLAWIFITLAEPDAGASAITAIAVLAGFPLVVVAARLLSRFGAARLHSGWAVAGIATLATISLPVGCLLVHGSTSRAEGAADRETVLAPAQLNLEQAVARSDDRLRLRIRGLTLAPAAGQAHPRATDGAGRAAELVLETRLQAHADGRSLEITVTLREIAGSRVSWRGRYRVDPDDEAAVHATLRRALSEAMRHTRQGAPPGQLVRGRDRSMKRIA